MCVCVCYLMGYKVVYYIERIVYRTDKRTMLFMFLTRRKNMHEAFSRSLLFFLEFSLIFFSLFLFLNLNPILNFSF